jgi:excisionase family DNA binding protein
VTTVKEFFEMAKKNTEFQKDKDQNETLLTLREVADRLRHGMTKTRELIWNRQLPHVRVGRKILVGESSLQQFINASRIEAASEVRIYE